MTNPPIIVEITLPRPISEVWDAFTNRARMVQWFFEDIPEFNPEVGFSTRFNVHSDGRDFMHLWTILEVEPGKKIVYDWRYEGHPGESTVTFELTERGGVSVLRVTHRGMDSFPQHIPEFSRESCQGGWNYFLARLQSYMGDPAS